MEQLWLEFEGSPLTSIIWAAVAFAGLLECARFIAISQRPASRNARLAIAVCLGVTVSLLVGRLRPITSSHTAACVALAGFAAAWSIRSYRRTTRSISPRLRSMLLVLRLAAVGVVLILLLQPVLQSVEITRERAMLGVLLDDSRSMTVRDVASGAASISRVQAVRHVLTEATAGLRQLEANTELRWFRFAADVREAKGPQLSGEGTSTALWQAVRETNLLLAQSGRKVAGLLVVSDGRDNYSAADAVAAAGEALAAAGIPLYAFGVGSEIPAGQTRRLLARRLDCPSQVAVFNRLPVAAEFIAAGLAETEVTITLLNGGEVVAQRQIRPSQVHELLRSDFSFVPAEPGLHRITVRAKAADLPEATLTQYVQVVQDRIQVLYIDRPRYERAAIVRALEASKDLRVTKLDTSRPPAPTASLQGYDVVLLGDLDRQWLGTKLPETIAALVTTRGRGLAALAGARAGGASGWAGTALNQVLPVDLRTHGELSGPVALVLTPAGLIHPICRLAPDARASESLWKELPPMSGATRFQSPKPAAEVLIRSAGGEPLLTVQEVGKGRSAVVGLDATWEWGMGHAKGLEVQRRFWRQLVLWLAHRRAQVWVNSERPRYSIARLQAGAEEIVLRAGVSLASPSASPELTLTGKLTANVAAPRPGATAPAESPAAGEPVELRWTREGQDFYARLRVQHPGEYRVTVAASADGQPVGQAEAGFIVEPADSELADPVADFEALRRLAGPTAPAGGGYHPLEEFSRVLEQIRAAGQVTETTRYHRHHLINEHPWTWLGLFVALIGAEWVLRRRAGLV